MKIDFIRARLRDAAPLLAVKGQLTRPVIACSAMQSGKEDTRFWHAVAAVQLAHEASLVHDDIIDGAVQRRGGVTEHVRHGVGAAIVKGDRLLAAGYAAAARTGSMWFVNAFAHAVESTIAGEMEQGRRLGDVLTMDEYERIIARKSGELVACAFATRVLLDVDSRAMRTYALGLRIGSLYQKVDDLLDYLPRPDAGKPVFGDYRQARWTWPLLFLGIPFGEDIEARLDYRAIRLCVEYIEREAREVIADLAGMDVIIGLIEGWARTAREAAIESWLLRRSEGALNRASYFSRNSRSFSFAARLLPTDYRNAIECIYAFCRFTDDLVDDTDEAPFPTEEILDCWERMARRSHWGDASGIAVIDDAMRMTPDFTFPKQLIAGMRMDLVGQRYETMADLGLYTHRVAGVVGQWLTSVFGISDPWVLERANRLGHAMQLTNILRDVGEDWRRGRLYLPLEQMHAHGVDPAEIAQVAETGVVTQRYRALIDELLEEADRAYADAREAIPYLPTGARRAISAAARIYQGIHDSLRANGYNNGTQRARTTWLMKARRALPALLTLLLLLVARPARAQLGAAWVAASEDSKSMPAAWAAVEQAPPGSVIRTAYHGALELLEARYGSWPPARLRHARAGFRLLDRAVEAAPDDVEIRYVRLMSYYYLPGFFGKKDIARADLDVVRELLPSARGRIPADAFAAIEKFVAQDGP